MSVLQQDQYQQRFEVPTVTDASTMTSVKKPVPLTVGGALKAAEAFIA